MTSDLPDPDFVIRTSGEKGFQILCYGKLPIQNYILLKHYGQISQHKNIFLRSKIIYQESEDLVVTE